MIAVYTEMKPAAPTDTKDSLCLKLADEVSSLVLDKFSELTSKVLADVVTTLNKAVAGLGGSVEQDNNTE